MKYFAEGKKGLLIFIICLFQIGFSFAQDTIQKRNGDEIKSKVLEVTNDEIKFKRTDNPDGPTYSILKADVIMVKYANGTKDVFQIQDKQQVQQPAAENPRTASARKRITLTISLQPSISVGGGYSVIENPTTSNSNYVAMQNASTVVVKLGAELRYNFTDKLGATAGLFYSKQGQNYKDYSWVINNEKITFYRNVSLNYLKIPFQFHFISEDDKKLTYFFSAGFYLGILAEYIDSGKFASNDGSTFTSVATGTISTQSSTGNTFGTSNGSANLIEEPFNKIDFGGVIEAGIQLRFGPRMSMPIGISYQPGFVNVKNKNSRLRLKNGDTYLYWQNSFNNSPNATSDYRNSLWGIKIGLTFKFQRKTSEKKYISQPK